MIFAANFNLWSLAQLESNILTRYLRVLTEVRTRQSSLLRYLKALTSSFIIALVPFVMPETGVW